MGKKIRGPKPQFRDWSLFFSKEDGVENRQKILEVFADFWINSDKDSVEIPGNCTLGGALFGVHGHYNGDDGITDKIIRIRRVDRRAPIKSRFPHDLLCAQTIDGQTYYFFSDNFNLYTGILINDAYHGTLKDVEDFYLHPKFRKQSYI